MQPSQANDVVRLRFLERPLRFYNGMTYHWRALLHVVILSFLLVYPSYWLVWRIKLNHANAEIMGRMDAGFQSDELKRQIRSFKKRKAEGQVETYEARTGLKVDDGTKGLGMATQEFEEYEKIREDALYKEINESEGSDNISSIDALDKKKE